MTKRIVALVAVLTLVMTMMILPGTASADYYAYSNCSNGKPLNVRSGPSKDYPVIGQIAYRNGINVLRDLGNGWSELDWGGAYEGYAMTSLLSKTDPGPYNPNKNKNSKGSGSNTDPVDPYKKAKKVDPFWVTVRGTRGSGSVNIRWAPSTSSRRITTAAYGSKLQVIADLDGWYQVVEPISGVTGFAMKKFLPRE